MKNNKLTSIIMYFAIFAVIVAVIILKNGINSSNEVQVQYSYNDMISQMVNSEVDTIEIQKDSDVYDSGLAVVHTKKGEVYGVQLTSVSSVMDVVNSLAAQNAIKVKTVAPSKTSSMLNCCNSCDCYYNCCTYVCAFPADERRQRRRKGYEFRQVKSKAPY